MVGQGNNSCNYTMTPYCVAVGGALSPIGIVSLYPAAPSATAGIPLVSNGVSSPPHFSTAVVAGGGSGATSFNVNGVVVSNTTTTGSLSALTLTDGQIVIGSTSGTPAAANLTPGANITITNAGNSITIAANAGSEAVAYTPVSYTVTPYTTISTDYYLGCDVSGGVLSILLPDAPTTGRTFVVKDSTGNAATNNLTITTVGGSVTIDGSTTLVISTNYGAVSLIFNGTSYEVY